MYARFKINVNEIRKLVRSLEVSGVELDPLNFEEGKAKAYKSLNYFTTGVKNKDEILDGSALQNYVFPTGDEGMYHVFISHSHDDKEDALLLAAFLKRFGKFNVFLDSYAWKSADGLLKKIDDKYCLQKNDIYNYHRRNFSTAHIHAMLSMAIMDIINKTDCCIFVESNHSIKLSSLSKSKSAKTLSPWIYEEYAMMKTLPRHRSIERLQSIYKADGVTEARELKIAYNIDMASFMNLSSSDIFKLRGGEKALDELYKRYDEFEKQLFIKKYGIQD